MRKLGLTTNAHVESSDFDRYVNIFKDDLTEEQVEMIRELFVNRVSAVSDTKNILSGNIIKGSCNRRRLN
jgi:hypothetical protein